MRHIDRCCHHCFSSHVNVVDLYLQCCNIVGLASEKDSTIPSSFSQEDLWRIQPNTIMTVEKQTAAFKRTPFLLLICFQTTSQHLFVLVSIVHALMKKLMSDQCFCLPVDKQTKTKNVTFAAIHLCSRVVTVLACAAIGLGFESRLGHLSLVSLSWN